MITAIIIIIIASAVIIIKQQAIIENQDTQIDDLKRTLAKVKKAIARTIQNAEHGNRILTQRCRCGKWIGCGGMTLFVGDEVRKVCLDCYQKHIKVIQGGGNA